MRENPTIQKLLRKFEPLAFQYANKVFNYERAGYEKSDIVQEFRIKIYTALLSYGQKWAEFKRTKRYKPVPLEFYIKSTLSNKFKDLVKQFNQHDVANIDKISFDVEGGVDVGYYSTIDSEIDLKKLRVVINEVDCLEGLGTVDQKRCFVLFLKGFTITQIQKIFRGKFSAETVIHNQIAVLKGKRDLLLDFNTFWFETHQTFED